MTPISETLRDLLVRQGIAQERTAIRQAQGIGAGLPWREKTDPLTARPGEDGEPMGMRKGRGAVKAPPVDQEVGSVSTRKPSPANGRPVPHIVVDNSRNWRTQAPRVAPLGVRQFLVLEGGRR